MIRILKKILPLAVSTAVAVSVTASEPRWKAVQNTSARKKAKAKAPIVFAVRKDQIYPVLGKTKKGWLKIRAGKDEDKVGFVPFTAMRPLESNANTPLPDAKGKSGGMSRRAAAGLTFAYSYIQQPGRTYAEASPSVEISSLTSSTFNIGAFYRFPLKETLRVRASLNMRKLDLTGTTKVLSGSVNTTPSNLQVTQDFFGIGAVAELLLSPTWWWGGGIEIAQASKSSVKTTTAADQPEKPLYVIVQLLTGFEYSFGRIFLAPEFRIHAIPNSTPMMLGGEGVVLTGFRF